MSTLAKSTIPPVTEDISIGGFYWFCQLISISFHFQCLSLICKGIDDGIDLNGKGTLQPNMSEEEIERLKRQDEYREELVKVFNLIQLLKPD